jgi:hypothetical protein
MAWEMHSNCTAEIERLQANIMDILPISCEAEVRGTEREREKERGREGKREVVRGREREMEREREREGDGDGEREIKGASFS